MKHRDMTIREFLLIERHFNDSVADVIQSAPKPDLLCGKRIPDNLNDLTFGELVELQSAKTELEAIVVSSKVLLGIDGRKIMMAPVVDVFGFLHWCANEMKRISGLFKSASNDPTQEERQAGIEQLNFGVFGIVDYYAQRMMIQDHDQVLKTPWVRVYKCLDIDSQKARFERKLRKVYESKAK